MIDWSGAQQRLTQAGYSTAAIDGTPGRMTFTALFAFAAKRKPDAILRAIGDAATVKPFGLNAYGLLDTPPRLAEFIAQTSHECADYTRFEESLRYSAKRLMAVWPRRFPTLGHALPYAWDASDPDAEDRALANLVYGSRMGNERNGPADDDGWDRRGRGMLMFTGDDNYRHYGALIGVDLCANPNLAADPAMSLRLACAYWKERGVNAAVDRGDFVAARQKVNGGTVGLEDVAARRKRLLTVLR